MNFKYKNPNKKRKYNVKKAAAAAGYGSAASYKAALNNGTLHTYILNSLQTH